MKKWWIGLAEIIDSFRIGPRLILAVYVYLVYYVVDWYMSYPLKDVTKCDSATLGVLLHNKIDLTVARDISCQVVDVVPHPTGYTLLMSAVIGAAAIVFGLYSNTARRWGKDGGQSHPSYPPYPPYDGYNGYDRQNRGNRSNSKNRPTNLNNSIDPNDSVG